MAYHDEHGECLVAGFDPATGNHPLRVTEKGAVVMAGRTVHIPLFTVPGVSTTLYTTADALGTQWSIVVPPSGFIQTVLGVDLTDQGVAFDILFFGEDFTGVADNAAFDLVDVDWRKFAGHISIAAADYSNLAGEQVFTKTNIGFLYDAPLGKLFGQLVTRGGPTYAVDELKLGFTILGD